MRLTWDGTQFIALDAFAQRAELKAWGFRWHPDQEAKGAWCTPNPKAAAHFRKYADADAKNKILRSFITVEPWVGRIPYPKGQKPLAYQLPAANFALARNRSYLALDPGLGKTIVMALVINALGRSPVVVVCPSGLTENTYDELRAWLTWKARICVYDPQKKISGHSDILLVPDVFLADPIGTYHDLRDRIRGMVALRSGTLFIDEAQRFGGSEAQRTKALLGVSGVAHQFDRVVCLSGTPLRKRPISLFPILSAFAGETIDFADEHEYGMKYCAGRWDGFGWDYSGESNFTTLAESIRNRFMLRLRKKDVLRDLPPKTEELVFIDGVTPPKIARFEHKHLAKHSPEEFKTKKFGNLGHVAKYQKLLGIAKIAPAVSIIKNILDEGDENILVVAEHQEVLERLAEKLASFNPLLIYGKTKKKMKQCQVDAFQEGLSRLMLIQTQCAVGYTLTKATRVVAVESSWVETDNEQAEDRTHRVGQTEPVFVQRLVFKNSMDRRVLESNLRTRKLTALL